MNKNRLTNRVSNDMIAYRLSEDDDKILYIKKDNKYWNIIDKLTMLESAIEQVSFERDIAISQLDELGYSLGEKINDEDKEKKKCTDCDLDLDITDCSDLEQCECQLHRSMKQYIELRGVHELSKEVADIIIDMANEKEASRALRYLVDKVLCSVPQKEKDE